MSVKDWITSPRSWGDWGMKANAWFNDLAQSHNANEARTAVLETNVRTLVDDYQVTGANIFSPWTLDTVAPYAPAWSFVDESGWVSHSGLVRNLSGGTIAAGANIVSVLAGFRPLSSTLLVPVASSVPGQNLYVAPTGFVTTELAVPNGGYVSLCWGYRIF